MRNPNALKWSDLKTGIFFILGIGFAAYLGLVIGKNSSLFTGVTTIKIISNNMQGLAENNFVSVSGKKIGTVSKLDFVTSKDSLFVVAELRLRNEFAPLVSRDAKATIKALGILGDKYVDITTGKGPAVQNGDYLVLQSEEGLADLTSGAGEALKKINLLLDQLNNGKGVAGRLVSDEKMGTELAETVSSLKTTSAELSKVSREASHGNGLLPKLLNDKAMAKNTEQTIERLNRAASETESLIAKINNGQGTIGQLQANPALYNNLNRSLSSLDSLLMDLKENPKRYVRFSLF
ncbi:MlaD family protein [Chlorobium phaeobacteroides]|jgi:phospholipid/cholesterol/gamma-HCH transport system substrate-binding protein|uniref:Mammalian cell entry related domain protein n=1 Tax=Chlorobium phaeobacteroides (strain DSM 266 / SMG 266 / 2430) TaxID=290317 RepID=A1BE89_CHLPD|nr:MlaD family protein [Chlorobium phaeobacteroides]ABL64716.1 Mammalian cell entry related domain protein [Chlorobium phaeobacteroides DSM 266]MBV5319447.1 MCE family protein [Chlorobium phaeobacteroides]